MLGRLLRGAGLTVSCLLLPAVLAAQQVPALPDSSGWGLHVLAVARDPRGALWVGTYGQGIYHLPAGSRAWQRIRRDTTPGGISWDFVHAFSFGPRGEIWYGTVGNGWGLSRDGGHSWTNWTYSELGPEWQYVAPDGIVTRAETTWVATADGVQLTVDNGAHWTALVDGVGPLARGPADTALTILDSEYVRRIGLDRRGLLVSSPKGHQRLIRTAEGWYSEPVATAVFPPRNSLLIDGRRWRGTACGLKPASDTLPCPRRAVKTGEAPAVPRTTWFRRPIDRGDNFYIDQTYRYGSTMGGNFQQHQGVEFNNADGTPVFAIGSGKVVYAGPAEQGALTVAILHDSVLGTPQGPRRIFSVYYHNSALEVSTGERVSGGQRISVVGNTGRATNDHLHLEVHAAPDSDPAHVVDSLQRFPPYTTNPELWIEPLPGTGIVAGRVVDAAGSPVPQARVFGLMKPDPAETPFSFAETYGDKAHAHPLYGEHFAVSDVPPGEYVLGVEIGGRRIFRKVTVEAGLLTWVVFAP